MPLWLVFTYCFFLVVVAHGAFRWHTSKINEWSIVGILGELFKLLIWIFAIAIPISIVVENAEASLIGASFCYFFWLFQTREKSLRRIFQGIPFLHSFSFIFDKNLRHIIICLEFYLCFDWNTLLCTGNLHLESMHTIQLGTFIVPSFLLF